MCPNALEVVDKSVDSHTRAEIREKYGVPLEKRFLSMKVILVDLRISNI